MINKTKEYDEYIKNINENNFAKNEFKSLKSITGRKRMIKGKDMKVIKLNKEWLISH